MQVIFETRHPEAARLRPIAERRIRAALRRLSWLAPRARVQLSDVNGPRGGIDKRCQVELITESTGPIIITSMARDWRLALQSALARAVQALLHAWQRANNTRRTRQALLVDNS